MTASDGTEDPYRPDVVTAVMRHMNEDHAEDSLLIVRSLGSTPRATDARMSGMDPSGVEFVAVVDGVDTVVRVPWGAVPTERRQVRAEVTRMYHDACAALGLEPRAAEEH